jgi:hypothetical protein
LCGVPLEADLVVVTVFVCEARNARFCGGITDAVSAVIVVEALHTRVCGDVTDGCLSATRIITRLTLVGLAFIFRHIHFRHVFYRAIIAAHIGHR